MKSFFQKTKSAVLVSDEVIHAEVYSASDLLEEESQKFLGQCNEALKEVEKSDIQTLLSLGFGNAKNVQIHVQKISEARDAKSTLDLIGSYKEKYPFVKFITSKCVTAVCEKYNLYLAEANKFIGEIPAKNQKEIIAFRVKSGDIREPQSGSGFMQGWVTFDRSEVSFERMRGAAEERKIESEKMVSGKHLRIIAPLNQLRMNSRDQIRNREIISTDPIVLQPVEGGYLIVTAWGKESHDEQIQNEALN